MSQKKAREQRKLERDASRPMPQEAQKEQLPPPANSTKPYTYSLKDSMYTWYAWQIRPRPLLRRLLLVMIVAFVWIAILAQSKPLEDRWTLYLFSLVAIPLYLLVAALVSTAMGFLSYQIKKVQFNEVVLYWDDNRVEWVNAIYSPKYAWSQFKSHFVTPRVVILALQGTLIGIPIRAFKSPEDLENFVSIAKAKAVGPLRIFRN